MGLLREIELMMHLEPPITESVSEAEESDTINYHLTK